MEPVFDRFLRRKRLVGIAPRAEDAIGESEGSLRRERAVERDRFGEAERDRADGARFEDGLAGCRRRGRRRPTEDHGGSERHCIELGALFRCQPIVAKQRDQRSQFGGGRRCAFRPASKECRNLGRRAAFLDLPSQLLQRVVVGKLEHQRINCRRSPPAARRGIADNRGSAAGKMDSHQTRRRSSAPAPRASAQAGPGR